MPNPASVLVTVVVPCRNEIRFIRRFLDSVMQQDFTGMKVEVLIADGMSDDGTRELLDQCAPAFPAVRILDNPEKIVSAGLNAAIREASGEVIIRMDVHSEYAPDYLQNCLRVLNETGAGNVGGPALTRAAGYMAQAIALAYHTRFACGGAKFHDPKYEGFVDTVTYGCWRKSTLERIGIFDESLVRCEDHDMNGRLIAAGGKIWQSPKITSWYWPRTSLRRLFHQYFQYGFWKVAVIRKHRKHAAWRHLVPVTCLLISIGLLLGIAGASLSGSVWWKSVFVITGVASAGLYCAASAGAAFSVAKRDGWRFLPVLPIVFGTYHLSYGLGFLLGLSYHPTAGNRHFRLRKVLTAITR